MRIIKLSIVLLLCVFPTLTLAAYHRDTNTTSSSNVTGWYLGVGSGLSSLMINYSKVALENSYYPVAYQATLMNFFPAVQLGYWGRFAPRQIWGVKAFYKYLGASTNYVFLTGAGGTYENNEDTQIPHEIAALLTFGWCMKKMTPYIGLGFMWLPTVRDILHNDDFGGGYDYSSKKSIVGGIVQLGLLYNINRRWFIDAVYSFGFAGNPTSTQIIGGIDVSSSRFARDIRITEQEIIMSINRRF